MDEWRVFIGEFEAYRKGFGQEEAAQMLSVLGEVVSWLRREGHGQVTLSAIDHRFGHKIEARTIIAIELLPRGKEKVQIAKT